MKIFECIPTHIKCLCRLYIYIYIFFFSFETNELSYSTWSYFESSRGSLSGICCEIGLKDGQTKCIVLNCSWWWHSLVYSEDLLWASVSIKISTWSWLRNGPCTAALLAHWGCSAAPGLQWTMEFESTHMIRKSVEGQLMFAQLFTVENKWQQWVHVCK